MQSQVSLPHRDSRRNSSVCVYHHTSSSSIFLSVPPRRAYTLSRPQLVLGKRPHSIQCTKSSTVDDKWFQLSQPKRPHDAIKPDQIDGHDSAILDPLRRKLKRRNSSSSLKILETTRRSLTTGYLKPTCHTTPHRSSSNFQRTRSLLTSSRTLSCNIPRLDRTSTLETRVTQEDEVQAKMKKTGNVYAWVEDRVQHDTTSVESVTVTVERPKPADKAEFNIREPSLPSLPSSEDEEYSSNTRSPAPKLSEDEGRLNNSAEVLRRPLSIRLRRSRSSTTSASSSPAENLSGEDEKCESLGSFHQFKDSDLINSTNSRTTSPIPTHLTPQVGSSRVSLSAKPVKGAFKSPMMIPKKPPNFSNHEIASASTSAQHSLPVTSTNSSKLAGVLLTKKLVELEQTLALIKDAERIVSRGSIQSVQAAHQKWKVAGREAAEYLWKISEGSSKSEKPSGYSGYGISSNLDMKWDNNWGFSQKPVEADSETDQKKDWDDSLLDYVSDEPDEDLPEVETLLTETLVRRYDGSGEMIKPITEESTSNIEALFNHSSGENTRSSRGLGNMMESIGIDPSVLGWDNEEEVWKD
ncbi:hypothetical protein CROQUDRAFT_654639 [Cronartium quercuum f. sp. fusiforme G11]|uniref:Uncharacterized protein n=1 Tax=Cronartium quercuum f. sp. fusiforme G11 TaxID=708437 RepID=A0A9P6NK89_9BASI|nr:hypothetical protein CROQUDRAFT_654639 [Cronartium quercuum f. sp. fusiforme G11]